MSLHFIRITEKLSFEDIDKKKVTPAEVYKEQVENWIIKPAQLISDYTKSTGDKDVGMALLGTLLLFFEPHGEYLRGEKGHNESRKTFIIAFQDFLDFIRIPEKHISGIKAEDFYKFVRCGLFHAGTIDARILIDSISCTKYPIQKNPHSNSIGIVSENYLVNPWLMLECIINYFDHYIERINKLDNSIDSINFLKTYKKLVLDPLNGFKLVA